ncbi:DUF2628 domain-containing protein [Mariluticola halotolerans]|uniref:DUF2628 domain-containing protein n=1 Tax=Mariluticola halotolerans TaxID=2909283 RepID=UPI0026E4489F|nr:DUF2628 domain-containing protein [Mariluticola halotolerans]UJQ93475.1 DUF2628 domain-containing protein [Mariluticola halotolerans]
MSIFHVFYRPSGIKDPAIESGALFVEERFSWFAALLPPFWAMAHGLWVELLVWLGLMVALVAVSFGLGDEAGFWLYVLGAVLLGFEAATIRMRALIRRGYQPMGDLIATDAELAEMAWVKRGVSA